MSQTKTKPVTPENMRALAEKMIDFFAKNEMWDAVNILVDNQMWQSDKSSKATEEKTTKKGTKYYVVPDIDIESHLEGSNPKTINITFEGPLYHKINYDDYDYIFKLTEKFLKPYGLYFEQYHAWSMAAFS